MLFIGIKYAVSYSNVHAVATNKPIKIQMAGTLTIKTARAHVTNPIPRWLPMLPENTCVQVHRVRVISAVQSLANRTHTCPPPRAPVKCQMAARRRKLAPHSCAGAHVRSGGSRKSIEGPGTTTTKTSDGAAATARKTFAWVSWTCASAHATWN